METRHITINPFTEPEKYQAWVALSAFRMFIDEECPILVKADEREAEGYAAEFMDCVTRMHVAMAEIMGMEAKLG